MSIYYRVEIDKHEEILELAGSKLANLPCANTLIIGQESNSRAGCIKYEDPEEHQDTSISAFSNLKETWKENIFYHLLDFQTSELLTLCLNTILAQHKKIFLQEAQNIK